MTRLTRQSAGWWRCTCGTRSWPSGRQYWCPADQTGAVQAPARWRWRSTWKKWCNVRMFVRHNRGNILTSLGWCHRIPPRKLRVVSWLLQSFSSDKPAWCSQSCCRQSPGRKASLGPVLVIYQSNNTYDDIAAVSNEISRLCDSKLLDLSGEGLVVAEIRDLQIFSDEDDAT